MNKLILLFSLLVSSISFAEMSCIVSEISPEETLEQTVAVAIPDNPHGAIVPLTFKKYTQFEGFVALSNGFTVINLVDQKTGYALSSQSETQGEKWARLQFLMEITDVGTKAIVVECGVLQ